jgi:hypothetical protein
MLTDTRCVKGGKVFHVETTAWEGPLAWKPPAQDDKVIEKEASDASSAPTLWTSIWSKK